MDHLLRNSENRGGGALRRPVLPTFFSWFQNINKFNIRINLLMQIDFDFLSLEYIEIVYF